MNQARPDHDGTRYRVLYVDDELTLLELGRVFLEISGEFAVDIIPSAKEALSLLSKTGYDAIVSDYQMPEMDGIGFLHELRSSGNDIPFGLFTGRGREEIVIRALNEGADFYLQKGGDPAAQYAELAHMVRLAVQRRQAIIALEESEHRYRNVVETQTEFISRFLPDGTHIFVNDAYCRYFGKLREEIIGHRFIPTFPAGDLEKVGHHLAALTPENPSAEIEQRIIMPDGSIHWQWWSTHAIFDREGNVTEYQSVGKDITDRKCTEEALQASENLYRTLFDSMGMASIVIGPDMTILRANKGWEKLTGIPREEQENRLSCWTTLFDTPDMEMIIRYHNARREDLSRIPTAYEARFVDRNKRNHYAIINVGMIPGTMNSIVSFLDITERREAEEAIREREIQLNNALSLANLASWEFDVQTGMFTLNDRFYELYGTSSTREGGYQMSPAVYFREFIHPDDREQILEEVNRNRTKSDPHFLADFEHRIIRRDGGIRYIAVRLEKTTSDNGHVIRIHGVNQDITARKEAEAVLGESEEKFRALADNAPFCIFIVENDLFHYANTYAIGKTGYSKEELGGMHYWDLIHPDERETVHAKGGAWQKGEDGPITGEIRFLTKNNETMLAFVSSALFMYREKPAAMISCMDVTDRRKPENEVGIAYGKLVSVVADLQSRLG
jgi:PAS domain S-box-containing protein